MLRRQLEEAVISRTSPLRSNGGSAQSPLYPSSGTNMNNNSAPGVSSSSSRTSNNAASNNDTSVANNNANNTNSEAALWKARVSGYYVLCINQCVRFFSM